MNIDSIKDYARYNLWANKQIAPYLEKIPIKEWAKEDIFSFGSIADTVIHITWVEYLWMHRLKKEAIKSGNRFKSKKQELVVGNFINYSKQFTDLILGFDELILK